MVRSALSGLLIFALAGLAMPQELRTVAGTTLKGPVVAIDGSDITIATADKGPVKTPLQQVLALDWRPAAPISEPKFLEVRFLDDSSILCKSIKYEAKEVELAVLGGATLKFPLSQIAAVQRDAQETALKRQFEKHLHTKSRRDRVLILRDGELNPLEGTFGAIDETKQTIAFEREVGGSIALPLEKLAGLIFFRNELPSEPGICRVIDVEGSILLAAKLELVGSVLNVKTTFGTTVPLIAGRVSKLDFNLGRLNYLSDLAPSKIVDSPWLGGLSGLRKDAGLEGGPIMLADRQYPKGLSMYANGEVEFSLAGKYKELRAIAGADPRLAEEGFGATTVSIYCDGKLEWSKEISVKTPIPVQINVKDVQTLRIVVRGKDATGFTAHATLADARVSQ